MSLSASARPVVGVRYPAWSSMMPGVLAGMVDFMRDHGDFRLVTENDSFGEMEAVKLDADWQGDGLIVFRAAEDELRAWRERGTAVVLTSTEGPDLGYPRVVPDNALIGRLAAEHLLDCAVPHFAYLARGETLYQEAQFAPGGRRYSRERFAAFRARLRQTAHEPEPHYLKGRPLWVPHVWREVESEVIAFLESLPAPCGLFAADDALAAVVLRAAARIGRRIPEDLVVIGYGDDPLYCFASTPTLTSIPCPARTIGATAAALLGSQMKGEPAAARRVEVPVLPVVARESSDMLSLADPEVRALVRRIRLQAPHEDMRVAELAEGSALSLTTIRARFIASLGRSPKQEIQRVRLDHLRHLLTNTQLSHGGIAELMKFGSSGEMRRFFTTATGENIREFRERSRTPPGEAPRPGAGVSHSTPDR